MVPPYTTLFELVAAAMVTGYCGIALVCGAEHLRGPGHAAHIFAAGTWTAEAGVVFDVSVMLGMPVVMVFCFPALRLVHHNHLRKAVVPQARTAAIPPALYSVLRVLRIACHGFGSALSPFKYTAIYLPLCVAGDSSGAALPPPLHSSHLRSFLLSFSRTVLERRLRVLLDGEPALNVSPGWTGMPAVFLARRF
jgi:hypothetical protein